MINLLNRMKSLLFLVGFFISASVYSQKAITIIQYNGVPDSVISEMIRVVKNEFNTDVTIVIGGMDTIDTEDAHRYLRDIDKHYGQKIIGVVNTPLYHYCEKRGVYGIANTGDKACVISTDKVLTLHEVESLTVHELGHTYGLQHCPNIFCYMNAGDGSLARMDRTFYICKSCRLKLKL